jgi:hypothetical protein
MMFEVLFRGQNSYESGTETLDPSRGQLRAWRPTTGKLFECDENRARTRYAELLRDGLANREVDGIVPFVIEIRKVKRGKKNPESVVIETMLWQYAEDGAIPGGKWTQSNEPVNDALSLN